MTHEQNKVVAVGLLTERDLAILGEGFRRAYRLDDHHDFHDLLAAIDLADQRKCFSLNPIAPDVVQSGLVGAPVPSPGLS